MKYKIILFTLIITIALGYATWDQLRTPRLIRVDENAVMKEKLSAYSAPSFTFADMRGKEYSLEALKGKTILLNFWATWCAPCVKEFPSMLELTAREDDTILLAISVDEEAAKITPFLNRIAPNVLDREDVIIVHDEGKRISRDLFQTVKYPETYIIAPDLNIRYKIIGDTNWMSEEIQTLLQDIKKAPH